MKKPRFSLRVLLILTAVLAVGCYWRARPRLMADRFAAAINAGEYHIAESMFPAEPLELSSQLIGLDGWRASAERQSISNWLMGKCYVDVAGEHAGDTRLRRVLATANGLYPVKSRYLNYVAPVPLNEKNAKFSRSVAIQLADAAANVDLAFYPSRTARFLQCQGGARRWVISYWREPNRWPGDHFLIWVDDDTQATEIVGGQ